MGAHTADACSGHPAAEAFTWCRATNGCKGGSPSATLAAPQALAQLDGHACQSGTPSAPQCVHEPCVFLPRGRPGSPRGLGGGSGGGAASSMAEGRQQATRSSCTPRELVRPPLSAAMWNCVPEVSASNETDLLDGGGGSGGGGGVDCPIFLCDIQTTSDSSSLSWNGL